MSSIMIKAGMQIISIEAGMQIGNREYGE
jgi:hypothetical protein